MQNLRAKLAVLGSLLVLAVAGGCASPVPGQLGITGKVLNVTIQTSGPMSPSYYYFFVINRVGAAKGGVGDPNGRGPIPVLGQNDPYVGYGNGFATGSVSLTGNNTTNGVIDYGLTDYVVYNGGQPNMIQVYHLYQNGNTFDPNAQLYPGIAQGSPARFTLPGANGSGLDNTLSFTLPLTQLVDPTNKTQQQIASEASNIHYIQVNIIATNLVSNATAAGKEVDSMGYSTRTSDLSSFITIDTTQNKPTKDSDSFPTLLSPEQMGDVYPPGTNDDSVDLIHWSITVSQQ